MLSIENVGQLEPAIINQRSDGTMVLFSGHRRKKAMQQLNRYYIECKVYKDLSYEQEMIVLIDANIQSVKTPSEIAK